MNSKNKYHQHENQKINFSLQLSTYFAFINPCRGVCLSCMQPEFLQRIARAKSKYSGRAGTLRSNPEPVNRRTTEYICGS